MKIDDALEVFRAHGVDGKENKSTTIEPDKTGETHSAQLGAIER